MLESNREEFVLHLYTGTPVKILASDVAYVDDDLDPAGFVKGTCVVLSKLDDAGDPLQYRVKEPCTAVARQLSQLVGDACGD